MRSFTVEENHIGSAVSKILWYRQTNIMLLLKELYKNYQTTVIWDIFFFKFRQKIILNKKKCFCSKADTLIFVGKILTKKS